MAEERQILCHSTMGISPQRGGRALETVQRTRYEDLCYKAMPPWGTDRSRYGSANCDLCCESGVARPDFAPPGSFKGVCPSWGFSKGLTSHLEEWGEADLSQAYNGSERYVKQGVDRLER